MYNNSYAIGMRNENKKAMRWVIGILLLVAVVVAAVLLVKQLNGRNGNGQNVNDDKPDEQPAVAPDTVVLPAEPNGAPVPSAGRYVYF